MRSELDVKITVGLALAIFLVLALFKGSDFSQSIFSVASSTVTATVLIRYVFVKWIWKWIPVGICGVPLLEGEWRGSIESTGNERTPEDRKSVPIIVTIVQPDMFTVKLTRGSDESGSGSFGERLTQDVDGAWELLYSYRSESNALVRDRSPISYGTARLKSFGKKIDTLSGDYWTDQKTTGVMRLARKKS